MKNLPNALSTFFIFASLGITNTAAAHGGAAILGEAGNNPNATGLAEVTCFDDGNGTPDNLLAEITDRSAPIDGLLINLQLYKGNKATSTTDPVSGDADHSPTVQLQGGAGVYRMLVNVTAAGSRAFEVTWHCQTSDGTHTGTNIVVRQFQ